MSDNNHTKSIVELSSAKSSTVNATVKITGRFIANFAWQHLNAACLFRNHVEHLERVNAGQPFGSFFEDIRSYSSGCIMSATACLEALINELYITHGGKLRSQFKNFDNEFWGKKGIERKQILKKYQIALQKVNAKVFDEQEQPYYDANGLIELRNALVHYKPNWDHDLGRDVSLENSLAGRFKLSPFLENNAEFVSMRCMSLGCAQWAIDTVILFVSEFENRAQLDAHKIEAITRLRK